VRLEWKLTVQGGFLKKPQVVDVVRREVDGQEVQFVEVTSTTPWLCEMVTGVYAAHKPLARTQVLERLKAEPILADAGPPDDMMAKLAFSDDEAEQSQLLETPAKKFRKGRGGGPSPNEKAKLLPEGVTAVPLPEVLGPPRPPDQSMPQRQVHVCREGKRWLIDVEALTWLVNHLAKEVELGGVAKVKGSTPEKASRTSVVRWCMANNLWRATCLDHNGERQNTSLAVHRRRCSGGDLREHTWEAARAKVYEEALDWILATSGKPLEEAA